MHLPQAVKAYEEEKAAKAAEEEANRKAEAERKMRERINRIIGESGMGDRFLRRTFETFQLTDDNRRAAAAARRYADSFDTLLPRPGPPSPAATAYSSQDRRAPARHTSPQPSPTT